MNLLWQFETRRCRLPTRINAFLAHECRNQRCTFSQWREWFQCRGDLNEHRTSWPRSDRDSAGCEPFSQIWLIHWSPPHIRPGPPHFGRRSRFLRFLWRARTRARHIFPGVGGWWSPETAFALPTYGISSRLRLSLPVRSETVKAPIPCTAGDSKLSRQVIWPCSKSVCRRCGETAAPTARQVQRQCPQTVISRDRRLHPNCHRECHGSARSVRVKCNGGCSKVRGV